MKTFEQYIKNKDIIITIPKKIKWNDYLKELDDAKNKNLVLNFKVSNFPKNTNVGNKCYVVYDGIIKGFSYISGFEEKEFKCESTGKKWKGKFIQRKPDFHKINPIEYKGFQGYRYFKI
jgi:hypothetical protein